MEDLGFAALSTLIWTPILLMVLGLLWAPFAALICVVVARLRGLDRGYGGVGARYSILFVFPWLYLVLRIAGVPLPRVVGRVGYIVLYGIWGIAGAASVIGGLFMAGFMIIGETEVRPADAALMFTGGLFIAVLWFISLRRLLRRHEPVENKPSPPMRTAYVLLHVLWVAVAISIFSEGLYEMLVQNKQDSAIPLWTLAVIMLVMWFGALKWFRPGRADSWDYPPNPPSDGRIPLHSAYIMPFAHLYLLIVIPALVGLLVYLFGLTLWL